MSTSEEDNDSRVYTGTAQDCSAGFLHAWIDGVELAGPGMFTALVNTPQEAAHWRQLTPNMDKIRKVIINKPHADAILIASMVCFFNAEEGAKLMNKVGCKSIGSLGAMLDYRRRALVGAMLANYTGW